jgi:thioredoxin
MNKKKIIFLVILVGVLFLTGCKNNLNTVKEIDFTTLQNKIENKETFILEIIQTGCSHCEEFSPRFRTVLGDYDLTGYSINLSNLTEEEKNKLYEIIEVSGTPTVCFFKKGNEEVMNKIVGAVSNKEIYNKLKDAKYIKN